MGKQPKPPAPPPDPPEPEGVKSWSDTLDRLLGEISARFPGVERRDGLLVGEPALVVSPGDATAVARFLKENEICPLNFCRSVTGSDMVDRYEVVYNLAHLPSPGEKPDEGFEIIGLVILIRDRENPSMPSLVEVWPGVDLQEREIFDLVGVVFEGHPDLRRVLLEEAFIGHPLRKDYPLIGRLEDMKAIDAYLDEHQIRMLKEGAGEEFNMEDVPPNYRR